MGSEQPQTRYYKFQTSAEMNFAQKNIDDDRVGIDLMTWRLALSVPLLKTTIESRDRSAIDALNFLLLDYFIFFLKKILPGVEHRAGTQK